MGDEITYTYEDAIEGFDEDDGSSSDEDEFYNDLHDFRQLAATSRFPMVGDAPSFREGATKATYQGNELGQTIYEKSTSDCSVLVERLAWVDGWWGKQDKDGQDEAMTLVVLKLGFHPEGIDARVRYASLQLKLKAGTQGDDDPQLVAWGPFRRPEMWNSTDTHRRKSVTPSLQLSGGGGGQQVTAGISRTAEVEWDERFTDYGLSSSKGDAKMSRHANGPTNGRAPNTVLWQVFENRLLKRGITPEIRVAALFARPGTSGSKDYRATVKIVAHLSRAGEVAYRVLRHLRIGYDGSDTIKWEIEALPGNTERCYAEGRDIIKSIDPANLGRLLDPEDRTSLNPQWLNKWDRVEFSAPVATNSTSATNTVSILQTESLDIAIQDQQAVGKTQKEVVHSNFISGPDIHPSYESKGSVKKDVEKSSDESISELDDNKMELGTSSAASAISINRLVELEKRVALAESRIAQQDQRIFELQQTLNRVAQALLVPSRSTL
ncbi:MAG: hypothetical protein STHCBS139747_006494 [Sporothrix thermara]